MDSIIRPLAVYLFLLVLFRVGGKRTLTHMTAFDVILLIIVGEAAQQALLDGDGSMTNGFLVMLTLVGLDILFSWVKQRSPRLERLLDGTPVIIVEHGRPLTERMSKSRVDENDVLTAARQSHGLERMEQIKYAVLERGGDISIVPLPPSSSPG